MDIENIARSLGGAKKTANGWECKCPAHQDSKPSLSLALKKDKLLVHCHTGCSQEQVISALKDRGLYESTKPLPKHDNQIVERKLVASYIYKEMNGQGELRIERFETPGGQKTFVQSSRTNVGESFKLGNGQLAVLPLAYDDWKEENQVVLVEGEKCAQFLIEHLIPATTTPGGSSAWKPHYSAAFKGKDVIIIPDNDEPGLKYAEKALKDIQQTCSSVSVLKLQGLEKGEDCVEYVAKNGIEALKKLIKYAGKEHLKPSFENILDFSKEIISKNKQSLLRFENPMLEDALAGLNPTDLMILAGRSGHGKSQLATDFSRQFCKQGKKVFMFALEAYEKEFEMRMLYSKLAQLYFADKERKNTFLNFRDWFNGDTAVHEALKKYQDEAYASLKREFENFHTFYRSSGQFTIQDFEREFNNIRNHVDLVIVDHLNFFDSHSDKLTENKATEEIVKRTRDCVLLHKIPVVLLSHVRKADEMKLIESMEDIHGTSNIFKIATKVLITAKDFSKDTENGLIYHSLFRANKDRYGDVADRYVFRCGFNIQTKEYEKSYQVGTIQKEKNKEFFEPIVERGRIPKFAKRATAGLI